MTGGGRPQHERLHSLAAADDFPGKTAFAARYQAVYGVAPEPTAQRPMRAPRSILDAIGRAGDATDPADLRERVRAAAVDPSVTHTSVIGDFKFDENGDIDPQTITIYRYIPRHGLGDRRVHSFGAVIRHARRRFVGGAAHDTPRRRGDPTRRPARARGP